MSGALLATPKAAQKLIDVAKAYLWSAGCGEEWHHGTDHDGKPTGGSP